MACMQKVDPLVEKPEYEGRLSVLCVTEGSYLQTGWIWFPPSVCDSGNPASDALLRADTLFLPALVSAEARCIGALASALKDFKSKVKWLEMKMAGYCLRRHRYGVTDGYITGPLNSNGQRGRCGHISRST